MMAVIFEVWPAPGRRDEYLKLAAELRGEVERIDGFISVERFESLYEEGKLLSLQFWRDDAAVARWRNHLDHQGPRRAFRRLPAAVAEVVRDYDPRHRAQAPADLASEPARGETV
jgi:heme-degrading monooxygenase HmoA